jgi:hypothetical protein
MYEQRDDRENQQQVNQETGDVENYESADPKDEQQYRDSEKRSESHRSSRALASCCCVMHFGAQPREYIRHSRYVHQDKEHIRE